jgi:hypothetical protein
MPESVAPPGQRARHRPRAGAETRDKAFLNVPYDRRYQRLYLAFIAGLSAFGLAPRVTIELGGSQRRLDRIAVCFDLAAIHPMISLVSAT